MLVRAPRLAALFDDFVAAKQIGANNFTASLGKAKRDGSRKTISAKWPQPGIRHPMVESRPLVAGVAGNVAFAAAAIIVIRLVLEFHHVAGAHFFFRTRASGDFRALALQHFLGFKKQRELCHPNLRVAGQERKQLAIEAERQLARRPAVLARAHEEFPGVGKLVTHVNK